MEYSEDLKSFLSYKDLVQVGGSHPDENKKLADVILQEQPNIVLETGIFTGSSTTIILECLKQLNKGILYSIDNLSSIKKWTGCYVTQDLKDRWIFIRSRTDVFFSMFSENFIIDIFLHDSEHTYFNMMFEYEWALQHINQNGGWILSHDINKKPAWKDFLNTINNTTPKDKIIDQFEIENLAGVKIKK